ncbi:cell wall-binding repeat-containing protein, partial [Clostridioides difficile]
TELTGSDRYETAVKISKEGWKNGSDKVVIINGDV